MENLDITAGLVPSLRAHRLQKPVSDVLQLYTTIWFAWLSVTDYRGPVDGRDHDLHEGELHANS